MILLIALLYSPTGLPITHPKREGGLKGISTLKKWKGGCQKHTSYVGWKMGGLPSVCSCLLVFLQTRARPKERATLT